MWVGFIFKFCFKSFLKNREVRTFAGLALKIQPFFSNKAGNSLGLGISMVKKFNSDLKLQQKNKNLTFSYAKLLFFLVTLRSWRPLRLIFRWICSESDS
jgi:hypothetical protein